MNVLTKISIVVLVVLVLFASAVFITKATVDPNWQQAANQQKMRADTFAAQASQLQVVSNGLRFDLEKAAAALDAAQRDAVAASGKAAGDLEKEHANVLQLQSDKETLSANVDRLTIMSKGLNDSMTALQKNLKDANDQRDGLAKDKNTLSAQLQEARSLSDRKDKELDYMNEQISLLNRQIEDLKKGGGTAGTAPDKTAAVEDKDRPRFTGTITAIAKDMASINIGSANGVVKGDKLIIYRDGSLLGYLTIETIDPNAAAGIITDKRADLAQGDKVTNKLK